MYSSSSGWKSCVQAVDGLQFLFVYIYIYILLCKYNGSRLYIGAIPLGVNYELAYLDYVFDFISIWECNRLAGWLTQFNVFCLHVYNFIDIPIYVGNPFTYTPLPGHPNGSTKVGRETTSRSKSELLRPDSVVCHGHTTETEVRSSDFDREVVSRPTFVLPSFGCPVSP